MLAEDVSLLQQTQKALLLTTIALIRTLAFSCSSPLVMGRGTDDSCSCGGLRYERRTLSLGNTNHFWQQTCLPFATAGDSNFIILNSTHSWFFLWKEHYLYLSKLFTIQISLENTSEQRQPVSLLARHAEMQKNDRKLSRNRVTVSWEIFSDGAFVFFSLPEGLLEF